MRHPPVEPGKRYSMLVAVALTGERTPAGVPFWSCRCDCGSVTSVRASHLKTGHTTSCGCVHAAQALARRETLEQRFWRQVHQGDGCWEWTGRRLADGYGQVDRPGKAQGSVRAHRLSWSMHFGDIPDGMNVCHRCDNPPCVNPSHLFLGTQQDNMQDCSRKGRVVIREQREFANAQCKVTAEDVVKIRELYATGGYRQEDLAALFPLSPMAIGRLVAGKTYRSAGGPLTKFTLAEVRERWYDKSKRRAA